MRRPTPPIPVAKHKPGGKDHDQSSHGRKRAVIQGDNWYAADRVAGALHNATAAYDEQDVQLTEDEARDVALAIVMSEEEYDDVKFNIIQDSTLGTQPGEPDHMKAAANFRVEGGNIIVFRHPTIAKTVLIHEIAHMKARDHGLDWSDTYLRLLRDWHPEAYTSHIEAVENEVKNIRQITLTKHMGPGPHPDGSPQKVHGRLGNKTLANTIESTGGVTYSPVGNKSPKTGFAMALDPKFEKRVPVQDFTPADIGAYRKKWETVLAEDNNHLGAWVQDGYVYLDVSVVVSDETEAMDIARRNEQRAIYNLETGEEIEVMALDEIGRFS